jgi:dTDP-4-dehydrorhamnose reductase
MTILITGGSGFVGWNAVRYFAARGNDVVATFHTFPHYLHQVDGCQPVPLDLADGGAIDRVVARFQPHIILHTAARARPQSIEPAGHMYTINVEATERLSRAAAVRDIPIVSLSTDIVFAADAGLCNEDTPTSPSGAGEYSRTKLLGEEAVRATASRWIIIRPTAMYGDGTPRSNSFTQFIDRSWGEGRPAALFTDQYRSFLFVDDLLAAVECVALKHAAWNDLFVCGAERMSRAEFGLRYAAACGADRTMCRMIGSGELEGYVGGPSDISLDCTRLRSLGWKPTPLEESFAMMLRMRGGSN